MCGLFFSRDELNYVPSKEITSIYTKQDEEGRPASGHFAKHPPESAFPRTTCAVKMGSGWGEMWYYPFEVHHSDVKDACKPWHWPGHCQRVQVQEKNRLRNCFYSRLMRTKREAIASTYFGFHYGFLHGPFVSWDGSTHFLLWHQFSYSYPLILLFSFVGNSNIIFYIHRWV